MTSEAFAALLPVAVGITSGVLILVNYFRPRRFGRGEWAPLVVAGLCAAAAVVVAYLVDAGHRSPAMMAALASTVALMLGAFISSAVSLARRTRKLDQAFARTEAQFSVFEPPAVPDDAAARRAIHQDLATIHHLLGRGFRATQERGLDQDEVERVMARLGAAATPATLPDPDPHSPASPPKMA